MRPLKKAPAFCGFSVDNIEEARKFYADKLGLKVTDEEMGTLGLHIQSGSGTSTVMIYPKENHEPATYTVLNFPVENIDEAVEKLSGGGIKFEQYEGKLQTDERGIFRGGGPLIAWFKDPAGNILSVLESGNRAN